MTKVLVVLGAHTDVGKTYATCALIVAARAKGLVVDAFKPVVSGIDADNWTGSDPGRILAALGEPLTQEGLGRVSPWRFKAALAPPSAAHREGRPLRLAPLVAACRERAEASRADLLIIETAGGVMSPVAEDGLSVDLVCVDGASVLLVGGSYLGGVSHTLTAAQSLRARGLSADMVLISEAADPDAPDFEDGKAMVTRFIGDTLVLGGRRDRHEDWVQAALTQIGC